MIAMSNEFSVVGAALRYADLGYPVFPCVPGGKNPLVTRGLLGATTDPAQIEAWWNRWPDANVAIRTDGLVVIDIDGPHNAWLRDRPDLQDQLASAPTAITPRGGRHHIFRAPEGQRFRNSAGKIAPNVDVRAGGGYIVVAPSVVGGKRYAWASGAPLDVGPLDLPVVPGWLVGLLVPRPDRVSAERAPCRIPEGGRNSALTSIAGSMRRQGMSEAVIAEALRATNIERCDPPLDEAEVATIARSVSRYAPEARIGSQQQDEVAPADGRVVLGSRDPISGRVVLSPKQTLPSAHAYLRQFNTVDGLRTLHGYGGLLVEWRDNRYVQVEDDWIRHRLQPWLHNAVRYVRAGDGKWMLVGFDSNPATVNHVVETIRPLVYLPASTDSPSWLDGNPDRPPAREILPCKTMSLHIPTGRVIPATPALFTFNALDFDYDPYPEPPERWIAFLEQLFGDDLESVELLQEWMGYCLTGDTSQQKMLLIVGPRRSGKGTIGRVIARLVGATNVAGPTTSSLAGPFGLQPLIDKSLAIVSDARFGGEGVGTVVERLLCISGEDTLSIDRKFLGAVCMKLPTRFMFLTNELPRLSDASTALAGRFLVLRLERSFFGCEDVALTETLMSELPGILLWAIDGWKRLHARGRFLQPESGADAIEDMEDLASPVTAFIRERCDVGPGHRVLLDDLYDAWRRWCDQDGRNIVSTKQAFGRDLSAVVPTVRRRRGTGQVAFYEGVSLRGVEP